MSGDCGQGQGGGGCVATGNNSNVDCTGSDWTTCRGHGVATWCFQWRAATRHRKRARSRYRRETSRFIRSGKNCFPRSRRPPSRTLVTLASARRSNFQRSIPPVQTPFGQASKISRWFVAATELLKLNWVHVLLPTAQPDQPARMLAS